MSKVYVRARYSKTGEETLELTGNINTKSLSFVTDDKKTYKIPKKFNRYHYKDRIIFASDEGDIEEEWILTLIPTKKILETMEIKEMEIEKEESDEETSDEEGSDDETDEESDDEESDDEDYTPNQYKDDVDDDDEGEYLDEEEYSDDEDDY